MYLEKPLPFASHEIIRWLRMDEPIVPADDADVRLTWVITLLQFEGQQVLMHNFNRKQYEVPSGGIEPGETPADAARREVWEETCQKVENLKFEGLIKVRLNPDGTLEYAAVFTGETHEILPFTVNNESDRIALWKPGVELDDLIGGLLPALLTLLEM